MSGFADQWIESLRNVWKRLNGDLVGQLADKVGGNRFVLLDSDGNEILSVDTAGNMTLAKSAGQMFKIDTNGNLVLSLAGSEIFRVAPTGNITVTPLGARFIADFSNGTVSNRFMFQTSTVNQQTAVYAIPNGSGTTAQYSVANSSDPNNAAILQLITAADRLYLHSTKTGSGTLLPLDLLMNAVQRLRVNTDGKLDVSLPGLLGSRYQYDWPFTRITSFTNSWVSNGGIHTARAPVAYYQDSTGKVFLTGAVSGGTINASAFTLPAGFRPSSTEIFCVASTGGIGRVDVESSGNVKIGAGSIGSGTFYLDGISFYPSAYDSLFTAVTFTSSWVDYAGGYMACGYYKDVYGRVHVRGLMKSGTIGSSAFNLPSGNRVWRNSIMAAMANGAFGRLDYYANGNIVPVTGSNVYYSVSGMMYPDVGTAPENRWLPLQELASGWIDYDAVNWPPAQAWRDPTGRVHANGLIKSGSLGLSAAHFIGNPWTPHRQHYFAVASNDAYGTSIVLNDATGIMANSGSAVWFSYGGVHWLPAV